MQIFKSEAEYNLGPAVAVLGTFDGVHIGHQALIRRAIDLAREENAACIVCTFDRHPLSLLCPEKAPRPLMSLSEKMEKFAALCVDGVLLHTFTREFAAIEPEDYLKNLSRSLQLKGVVAGFNYSFGAKGRGDAALIRQMSNELSYRAEIVSAVQDENDIVSSTLIRNLLQQGQARRAHQLLSLQMR